MLPPQQAFFFKSARQIVTAVGGFTERISISEPWAAEAHQSAEPGRTGSGPVAALLLSYPPHNIAPAIITVVLIVLNSIRCQVASGRLLDVKQRINTPVDEVPWAVQLNMRGWRPAASSSQLLLLGLLIAPGLPSGSSGSELLMDPRLPPPDADSSDSDLLTDLSQDTAVGGFVPVLAQVVSGSRGGVADGMYVTAAQR